MITSRTFLIGCCWACLTTVTVLAEGVPQIKFDEPVYDFGTTSRVQTVEGVFFFSNVGDGDLQLTTVKTTCICTRASPQPKYLKPGEHGHVEFSVNLGPSVGDIVEKIFISSNDPKNPKVTLTVRLYIPPIFEVTPRTVRLGDMRQGATTNLAAMVTRTDGQRLRVTKLVTERDSTQARTQSVKEARGKSVRILIKYTAPEKIGSIDEAVRVHTGEMYAEDIPKPSFDIQLKGRVISAPK